MYTSVFIKKSWTPAGLPRAGENSKPHQYKHKLQKTKDFPKTWGFNGEIFEDFRQKKEQKHYSRSFKKPSGTQGPRKPQFSQSLVNSKIRAQQNLKNCIQIKTIGTLQN